jgi:hypothetical protein
MSTVKVTEIQSNSGTFDTAVNFQTNGGTQNGRLCKVWVDFNGYGTVAIRNDFNVNSVSDRGTGQFTVNYSNALASSTYCCHVTGSSYGDGGGKWSGPDYVSPQTGTATGSVAVRTWRYDGNPQDWKTTYVTCIT